MMISISAITTEQPHYWPQYLRLHFFQPVMNFTAYVLHTLNLLVKAN